jgi:putative hydrolase of the HAD superfamily
MKSYHHIYFDLDRTLWDFQKNSSETLKEIIDEFGLYKVIKNETDFIEKYNYFNDHLWDNLKAGKISKVRLRDERFRLLMAEYNIDDPDLIAKISRHYLNNTPSKTALIPGTIAALEYLSPKYQLYIISNGFQDIQLTKMINSGIAKYFKKVYTSDVIGYAKPKPEMFNYAINSANARKKETLMVGDDPVNDIWGAYAARIDQVFFNPEGLESKITPTFEIKELTELLKIL